jgi:hypothetical protein
MGDSNDRLRKARMAAGWKSARQAALKFHWRESTYASHENGQTDPVPSESAKQYADAFGTTDIWILHGIGPGPATRKSIDARLAGLPDEIWDEVHASVDHVFKYRGIKPPSKGRSR